MGEPVKGWWRVIALVAIFLATSPLGVLFHIYPRYEGRNADLTYTSLVINAYVKNPDTKVDIRIEVDRDQGGPVDAWLLMKAPPKATVVLVTNMKRHHAPGPLGNGSPRAA
jgi:hypothetical protein